MDSRLGELTVTQGNSTLIKVNHVSAALLNYKEPSVLSYEGVDRFLREDPQSSALFTEALTAV